MTFTVYTSIMGDYDSLKMHPEHDAVDRWLCFTDNPQIQCSGWETVLEPSRFSHPRLSAKWRKCHPPESTNSLWVDGSVQFNADYIDAILVGLESSDVVMFPHPERTSIIEEARVSERMIKYRGLPVMAQARHYLDAWGWPDNQLWASTTFGRRHTPEVMQFGAAWFAENENWTYQDQLSLPPVLARYGIRPEPLGYSLWRNPWFGLHGHASEL